MHVSARGRKVDTIKIILMTVDSCWFKFPKDACEPSPMTSVLHLIIMLGGYSIQVLMPPLDDCQG